MQRVSGVLKERSWKVQRLRASVHFLWPHFGTHLSRSASLCLIRRRHHPARKSECALVPAVQEIFWTFKRRAHINSLIIVHVGVGQRCRAMDQESSTTLPTMSTRNVPEGRWINNQGQSKGEHTTPARLSYTLVLVSVAVPWIKSPPPPCQP